MKKEEKEKHKNEKGKKLQTKSGKMKRKKRKRVANKMMENGSRVKVVNLHNNNIDIR